MSGILQDVRYAVRQLRKSPGFTAVAMLTLALGIGANTAIFSVVYGVLLRPLPYPHSERIVQLCELNQNERDEKDVTYSGLQFLRAHANGFQAFGAFSPIGFNFGAAGTTEHVNGLYASADYFRVLQVTPIAGRSFMPEEDSGNGAHVVLLSETLLKRMGRSADVLGQTVLLDGVPYTVVGIMPSGFERISTPLTHGETEVWAPISLVKNTVGSGSNLAALGRLKDGISLDQARSRIAALSDEFRQLTRDLSPAGKLDLQPYQTMLSGDLRTILLACFGAVAFVLLIACANVANLLIGRAVERSREFAIRTAVGGSRARLLRQFITESTLLAVLSASAASAVAWWGIKLILLLAPVDLPRAADVKLDLPALAFAFGVALLTGFVLGLAPAFRCWRFNLNEALKESAGQVGRSKAGGLLRQSLVVGQIGLALIVVTGAALLTQTFWRVLHQDPGFDPDNVFTIQLWLNGSKHDSMVTVANFYDDVLQRIQGLPGVRSTAVVAAGLPLERGGNMPVKVNGVSTWQSFDFRMITPGYFKTLDSALKSGRVFTSSDNSHAQPVAIISESLARKLFPRENALGRRLSVGEGDAPREIVGVVGDVRSYLDRPPEPAVFIPVAQSPYELMKIFESWFGTRIVVRSAVRPEALGHAVEEQIHDADPSVATGHIRTMEQVRSSSVAARRFNMLLMGSFGVLAALLAAIGIYGVVAYTVNQRTREIAVRITFGAGLADVLRLVYSDMLLLATVGIAAGTASALALTRLLESYLYEIKSRDPLTFVITVSLLAAVAIVACAVPALRAAKVDPMVALRYE